MKARVLKCVKEKSDEYLLPSKLIESTEMCANNPEIMDEPIEPPSKKHFCDNGHVTITKFISKTTVEVKTKIDFLVAKLFYAFNISLVVAESEAFKNLIHAIKPIYKSPSLRQLAGELLDVTYDSME